MAERNSTMMFCQRCSLLPCPISSGTMSFELKLVAVVASLFQRAAPLSGAEHFDPPGVLEK